MARTKKVNVNVVEEKVKLETVKDKIKLNIILLNEVIKGLETENVPFIELEKTIKPIETIEANSYIACYCKKQKEHSLRERLILPFNTTGISVDNTVYCLMGLMIGNIVLIEKNTGAFRIGEAEMSKSSMTSLVFANVSTDINSNNYVVIDLEEDSEEEIEENSISSKPILLVRGGIPTEPWLRGKELNLKNYNDQKAEKVPLEYPTLVFEEIMGISDIDNTMQYIKQTTESGRFFKRNQIITNTETSLLFVANNYTKGYNLQSFTLDKLFSRLPKIFMEDEAIFHRYPYIIPHYKKTFGEIKFIDENTEGIFIEDFAKVIKELREKKCLIDLKKYNLKNRQLRNFYKGISSFIKIMYPESVIKENTVPEWVIDGVFEFVKHFNSFTLNKEVYNPFNANSAKFIAEMLGFTIEKIEYIMFHEERILIKNMEEDFWHKIGLTGYGIEQNLKEFNYYKENPDGILEIFSINENGKHITQKYGELYSEDVICIRGEKRITHEEYNENIIKRIENGSFDKQFDMFKGIPDFYIKIAQAEAKRIFQINNAQVTKNNFVLVDGEIKFVNFSEFIRKIIEK